ncbi:MAG TPA: nucleotidyltransferase domain-containing protein [Terriglobia bacterium]|nr:nucleotidyltransferase domain-containing protein [Terriglobia bacterium]
MRTCADLDALFPKTRQAILVATLLQPSRWWYMRELARHLGVPPSSLQRELDSLARAGILRRKREGKHVYFAASTDSPIFPQLSGIFLRTAGLVDVVRAALKPFAERVRWAFIYGSIARGSEHVASDVDLMIIGRVGLAELSTPLRRLEQRLSRAVNPMIYTPKEFARHAKSNHRFVTAVLRAKKLFVLGDPREFKRAFGK